MTAAGPAAPRDSRLVLERPSRRQPRARPLPPARWALPAARGEPAGRGEKLSTECGRVPPPNKRAGTGRGAAGRGTRLPGARSAAEPRGSPPGTRFPAAPPRPYLREGGEGRRVPVSWSECREDSAGIPPCQ